MLRKPPISVENKLFSFLVANFLENKFESSIESNLEFQIVQIPESLQGVTKEFNMIEIEIDEGEKGGKFAYRPANLFNPADLVKLKAVKEALRSASNELIELKSQLGLVSDDSVIEAHQIYMARLHRYNEAKDLAQALLGKLAHFRGKTTKELYPEFDLLLED